MRRCPAAALGVVRADERGGEVLEWAVLTGMLVAATVLIVGPAVARMLST